MLPSIINIQGQTHPSDGGGCDKHRHKVHCWFLAVLLSVANYPQRRSPAPQAPEDEEIILSACDVVLFVPRFQSSLGQGGISSMIPI